MIKDDFPYFKNSKTTYLDNGSTTQKPQSVIDSITSYYTQYCSNTHRGSYKDGNRATKEFEASRSYIRDFIGAKFNKEIIFTKGVTEGINMVASSFVNSRFKTVIISSLEHHSNIVPWHIMGRTLGEGLEVVRYREDLSFDLEHFEDLLRKNPNSFVSITHISNAFGVVNPVKEITGLAHKYGCKVLVDGAQALSRLKVDVKDLGVDFYIASSHKSYGPTGVGVLYINEEVLPEFSPYQTGGAVIERVSFSKSTLLDSPHCFEAGTQNIAGVIGFKTALKYIDSIGYKSIAENEDRLVNYIIEGLKKIDGVRLYTGKSRIVGNVSFNIQGLMPIDIGLLLDKQNISIRAGHHCAMPIMESLNIDGTVRISLGVYNNESDIKTFFKGLDKAVSILRK
ncbi:cysteine desulfurase [Thiospirochaeta perfilievii]|uniref:Probable cysteine desulfurase n=1 Tax=Thiospirochaeta perfilievii TaxID=252967 RepID=A0A5C1QFJ3_9SPIO|nr:cysteine desulfurase [Thiospirochaeta perfilievii]QEN04972.1 cysteine desulfurase [Thiospirochaeta perfilievii]